MKFNFAEIQIFVSEVGRAIQFYNHVLGLDLVQSTDNWAIFKISNFEIVLMGGAKPNQFHEYGSQCQSVICLSSESIDIDIEKLRSIGVSIIKEIQVTPQGKFAVISDVDGNYIEIIQQL